MELEDRLTEINKLIEPIGKGTTEWKCHSLVDFNDKYVLVKKKGNTGYVGRISGNRYGAVEHMVFSIEYLKEQQGQRYNELAVFPGKYALFFKEGKLTKEEKSEILVRFGLSIKNKRKTAESFRGEAHNKYIIFYKCSNIFMLGRREKYFLEYGALKRMDATNFIVSNDGKERTLSKKMYDYKIIDGDSDVDGLQREIKIFTELVESQMKAFYEISNITKKLNDFFDNR